MTIAAAPNPILYGNPVAISGKLTASTLAGVPVTLKAAPAHDGQMVLIQRRSRTGTFVTVATATLLHTTTGASIYRKTLRIKASGTYRVVKSHDAYNAIGVSALHRITAH